MENFRSKSWTFLEMKIRKFGWKESKIQKLKNLEIFLKIEKLKRCYFVYFEFENSRIWKFKKWRKSRNIRSRKFQKSKIKKIIFDRINIRQSEIVVCIKSFPPLHASLSLPFYPNVSVAAMDNIKRAFYKS